MLIRVTVILDLFINATIFFDHCDCMLFVREYRATY